MLKLLISFLIFHVAVFSYAQEVTYLGKVVDTQTKQPISNASVFFKGTTEGTNTNTLGYFELKGTNEEIVVSHIGYETITTQLKEENPKLLIPVSSVKYTLKTLRFEDSVFLETFHYDEHYLTKEIALRSEAQAPLEMIAEFPKGQEAFQRYLKNGLFKYCDSISTSIDVSVYFSVQQDGTFRVDSILNVPEAVEFVYDLFENSPKWIPAFQRHVAVVTSYKQQVIFDPKTRVYAYVEEPPKVPEETEPEEAPMSDERETIEKFSQSNALYFSGELNAGNYWGMCFDFNYVYKEMYSFSIGIHGNIRESRSKPDDYLSGLTGILSFGLAQPIDRIKNVQVTIGKIIKLNVSGKARINLSFGLGYTTITEPHNFQRNGGTFFTENYTYDYRKFHTFSAVVNPKFEFPFSQFVGLTISPMAQINGDRYYVGVGFGLMLGYLRN